MFKKLSLFCSIFIFQNTQSQNLTQYINPMIGTGGHGHTFPGATLPFGMVQLSPDTRIDGSWDGCSGYHYSDTTIYGFSHTHLSGTGCSDYGDFAFMPYFGTDLSLSNDSLLKKGVRFSHTNEVSKAGYYSVILENGVKVELTSTTRAGLQKYTFPNAGTARVILNLKHRDELLEGVIKEEDMMTYSGKRVSKAWAEHQEIYFFTHMNKLPSKNEIIKGKKGDELLVLEFEVKKDESVLIKTGISNVDERGAMKNLDAEMLGFDFDRFRYNANAIWNSEMSKIITYGGSLKEKTNFYTALYHCMIHPSVQSDVDNRYRSRDGFIYPTDSSFEYYSVFSLWDTYRALHPLLSLIDVSRTNDFIKTFIKHDEQVKRLPIWELSSNETNCMIGYHAVSVIWDAYNKGIGYYNAPKAFNAMKRIANDSTIPGLSSYLKYGYVRADDDAESVSKTLEFAYNDWCIAQFAKKLNIEKDYKTYSLRSNYWRNVYDPQTGFMRPRLNSTQMTPFSPYMVDNNFTEANSFQYSFYVPQNIPKLAELHGGDQGFEKKLDELFTAKPQTEGRDQADITGLIGQYAHGNEPSHHIAFLYKNPEKRNQIIKKIRDEFYTNEPDGLIGNEDCGQMSAWYVLAAMGFYQVCPGDKRVATCTGIFDSIQIKSDIYTISRYKNDTAQLYNIYTQNIGVDDAEFDKTVQPYILPAEKIFKEKQWIKLAGADHIMYAINGGEFKKFKDSLLIDQTCKLAFYSVFPSGNSFTQEASFHKLPNDRSVKLMCTYGKAYHAGGPMGLVDGILGTENWRKGDWQGYQGQDFEAIIELKSLKPITEIKVNFLQDQRAWIFNPIEYEILTSLDGQNYASIHNEKFSVTRADDKVSIKRLKTKVNSKAKYVKIKAKNYGKIPNWHPGAGGDAYIFVDEIEVK